MTHLHPDCPRCEGAGILNIGTDSEGNEKIFYCPACDGRGTRERQDGGGTSQAPVARLSDVTPFDVRWERMERSSEDDLRRLEC